MRILQQCFAAVVTLALVSLAQSEEDGMCLLQKRAFRGRDTPATRSVTLGATRNRTGHSGTVESGAADEEANESVNGPQNLGVDPGVTDDSSATLDSTLNGKESVSDYFSTHRETREVNRREVTPDGYIHHTLSEKTLHETADGREVHHHERHEIYREVRYPESGESGDTEAEPSDESFASDRYAFPENEGDDTEESGENEDEDDVNTYYAEVLDHQTYYSHSPPSADQLLEEEAEPNYVAEASECYYSSAVDEVARVGESGEDEFATSAPDQIISADDLETSSFGEDDVGEPPDGAQALTSYSDLPETYYSTAAETYYSSSSFSYSMEAEDEDESSSYYSSSDYGPTPTAPFLPPPSPAPL